MTQVRDTSLALYQDLVSQGLLRKRSAEVYLALLQEGPMTGQEADAFFTKQGNLGQSTSAHKRLPELHSQGLVFEARRRACRVTSNLSIEWEAVPSPTNVKPFKAAKKGDGIRPKMMAALDAFMKDYDDSFSRKKGTPEISDELLTVLFESWLLYKGI